LANKGFNLQTYFEVLNKNRKKILVISLLGLLASIVVAFFILDPIYLSNGVIKTTSKSSKLGGLLGSSGLPDLGDFGDLASGGGSSASELALYENILYSRRCIEETIIKFNLFEENEYKTMFDALKDFRENIMEITKDKVAGTIGVGIYDKDPKKAKEMADFLIFQLNKINIELNVLGAKNNREYMESRYNLVKGDLVKAEDSLIDYQNRYGIAPDIVVQASVKAGVELEGEIKSEEIKLELLRKILSPDQAEVRSQEEKIAELKKQLISLQTSTDENSSLRLKGSPKIVIDFLRMKRDVEIQTKIMTTILPMLEQAKIEERKETPTILILDAPQIPDKKTKPKRMTVVLFSVFICFFVTYFYFLVKDNIIPLYKNREES